MSQWNAMRFCYFRNRPNVIIILIIVDAQEDDRVFSYSEKFQMNPPDAGNEIYCEGAFHRNISFDI